jgi:hypothetical protein
MRQVEIPVKMSIWRRYKGVVLVPPRKAELRRELDNTLSSGGTYYGTLKAVLFGEPWQFKVGVKFYRWEWENRQKSRGLNTHFVITETDCKICIENIEEYINKYGNARGTLTLYLP